MKIAIQLDENGKLIKACGRFSVREWREAKDESKNIL